MRVVAMSDTHVPSRAKDLPAELWSAVDAADLVIHAGDWMAESLLDELASRSRRLLACWGNNDGDALRARLPETATEVLEGVRVAVTHETGSTAGRAARMARAFPGTDLLVFGHSHIPWDTTLPGGLRLLNPGSPTDRRRQPTGTYLTFSLGGGAVRDVTLHPLPRPAEGAP